MSNTAIQDIELHAYVDDELDSESRHRMEEAMKTNPEIVRRIAAIRALKLDVSEAFSDTLSDRLPQGLIDTVSTKETVHPMWMSRWAAAACLVAGLAGGFFWGSRNTSMNAITDTESWVSQVANYQDMYSLDTLMHVASSAEDKASTLERLSSSLDRSLIIPEFSNTDIEFKRGQLLSSNGNTVVQLAFLDSSTGTPIAFCFTPTKGEDREPENGTAFGTHYVNWSEDGLDFVVIGKLGHPELNKLATEARDQYGKLPNNS